MLQMPFTVHLIPSSNCIASIMALTVGYMLNELLGLDQLPQDRLDHFDIGTLIMTANILDLTDAPLVYDQIEC